MLILTISAFLGRFHPLIVHLPIGFILAAVLIEWRLKDDRYRQVVAYMWLASGVTAAVASICGWFLANQGSYANWTLFFHRWLGILIALISIWAWYIRRDNNTNLRFRKFTNVSVVIMLAITGHLGGNMTHGADYLLEYAPSPIQKLLGYGQTESSTIQLDNPDSVFVYRDIIYPSFEKKCLGCHSDKVQNGGLNMASIEAISKGGDGGPVLIGGDISSEILRRVTLPVTSAKFMPTSGTGLSYHEVKLLEWWISEGASYEAPITELNTTPSIEATLLSLYGLDMTPRPWIEKTTVPFLDSLSFTEMRATGLKVNQLAQNNGWVEVSLPFGEQMTRAQLEILSKAAPQITWLNLSNSGLTDEDLSFVKDLPHLTRVRIHGNEITSDGVKLLANMKYVESLNLTNTKVDDTVFEILPSLPALKNLYVWQSNVTSEAVSAAQQSAPQLEIVIGDSL